MKQPFPPLIFMSVLTAAARLLVKISTKTMSAEVDN
ncbi:hypothetical protein ABID58_002437 [Bradyrhizobium sp. S3.2.6]